MLEVDGKLGGGSVLRIAIPYAIAAYQSLHIKDIRHKRPTPGLRTQHLKGIQLLADLTGSTLIGAKVGSTSIEIHPGDTIPEPMEMQIPTAGAVSLIYQLLSNYSLLSKHAVAVEFRGGGTHTQWSPNFDYLQYITLPALQMFGQQGSIILNTVGYYPKGGARGSLSIRQRHVPKVRLDPVSNPEFNRVISRASTHLQKANVAARQAESLISALNLDNDRIHLELFYDSAQSVGSSITVLATDASDYYIGYSALGKKGVSAEKIGKALAQSIVTTELQAATDEYLADQLMLALSLSPSGSYYTLPRITKHVDTNLQLINQLTSGSLEIDGSESYQVLRKV